MPLQLALSPPLGKLSVSNHWSLDLMWISMLSGAALTLKAHFFLTQLDAFLIPWSNLFLIITNYNVWYQEIKKKTNYIFKFEAWIGGKNGTEQSCQFFPFEDQILKNWTFPHFDPLKYQSDNARKERWQFSYLPRNAELGVINEWLDHTWHFTKWLTVAPALVHADTCAESLCGDEKEGGGQNWVSSQGTQWVQKKKSSMWIEATRNYIHKGWGMAVLG